MEKITRKIVAIGGGGFTHESDDTLDQFFLDQCRKKKIKLGFLATASKDDKEKINLFYKKVGHLIPLEVSLIFPIRRLIFTK